MLNNFLLSTGSDNFIEGLGISLAGIIIVFAVLLIICAVLYGFGKVFAQKPAAAPAVEPAAQDCGQIQNGFRHQEVRTS